MSETNDSNFDKNIEESLRNELENSIQVLDVNGIGAARAKVINRLLCIICP